MEGEEAHPRLQTAPHPCREIRIEPLPNSRRWRSPWRSGGQRTSSTYGRRARRTARRTSRRLCASP
eukprot:4047707-Pleurochrysis_carterae.AAC.1